MSDITIRVIVSLTMTILTNEVDAMVFMDQTWTSCARSLLRGVVCATILQDSAEDLFTIKQIWCLYELGIQAHLFDM